MKISIQLLSLLSLCVYANFSIAQESIVVVANIDKPELSLSKQEVRNLFLGGFTGYGLTAVELPPSNALRILFNTKVVGLTEARIQSYWAQMKFSGRKKPLLRFDDEQNVLLFLTRTKGAVTYMSANKPIPVGLTVIYASN